MRPSRGEVAGRGALSDYRFQEERFASLPGAIAGQTCRSLIDYRQPIIPISALAIVPSERQKRRSLPEANLPGEARQIVVSQRRSAGQRRAGGPFAGVSAPYTIVCRVSPGIWLSP
jgi:hypothetical protein